MTKVKTFMSPIRIFQTANELQRLDEEVNKFLAESQSRKIISVNDACTSDTNGATIGIIRVLAYEEP